jgi:hypothetical protein
MAQTFPSGILQAKKNRFMRTVALTAVVTLVGQNFAWAVCSDGISTVPGTGGWSVNSVSPAGNWSPNVFTAPAQSVFVPDNSVNENNDTSQPYTNGGHNWVFDQGSTLCKETDVASRGMSTTTGGWAIPANTPTECIVLPVIKNGGVVNLGDIPYQGQAITPTCDPTLLSTITSGPNPKNTYFNQLGCSISHGLATTPQTATTFLFLAGIKGGMFAYPLDNANNSVPPGSAPGTQPGATGTEAGKTVGSFIYYSGIPEGQKLTSGVVSPDGMFAMATSIRRNTQVWACLNPLGDPGDPLSPIDPFFSTTNATAKCMGVGTNGLTQDSTTTFGPDNQPYFGGQRVVTTFNNPPGGNGGSSWPQCMYNGAQVPNPSPQTPQQQMANFVAVFKTANTGFVPTPPAGGKGGGGVGVVGGGGGGGGKGGTPPAVPPANTPPAPPTTGITGQTLNLCGNAQANAGLTGALITQPQALISHIGADGKGYMYTGPLGGTIVQILVTSDPSPNNGVNKGQSRYKVRTLLTGISLSTGLGVADDLGYGVNGSPFDSSPTPKLRGGSLMIMTDPSAVGLAAQGVVTRLPLCEDM